nr:unnamed protein product [Callosobruchus analis]
MTGKFSNSFSRLDARREWERISQDLNSIPGARKDWIQWRKVSTCADICTLCIWDYHFRSF